MQNLSVPDQISHSRFSHCSRHMHHACYKPKSHSNEPITLSQLSQYYLYAVPAPASVAVTSSPITVGDPATLNCTVELVPAVMNSDLVALVVDVQLNRPDGNLLSLSGPILSGTTFTYITQVHSFGRNDSGVYTCGASVRPKPSLSEFLTESSQRFASASVTTGIILCPCTQAHCTD